MPSIEAENIATPPCTLRENHGTHGVMAEDVLAGYER
jgi:hypothetical protein